jgi:hypothetical protein
MNQPAMTVERTTIQQPTDIGQPLHGTWLLIARVAWVVVAVGTLALNFIMLPQFLSALLTPCAPSMHCFYLRFTPYDEQIIRQTGLTRDFIAQYEVWIGTATMLVYYAIAAIIFLRRSADRMALFCSFALVLFGGVVFSSTLQDTLPFQSLFGYWLFGALFVLAQSSFLIFLLLFPNGRFTPQWSRWLVPLIIAYWAYDFLADQIYVQTFNLGTLLFIAMLLIPPLTQIYRYRRVSTPRERQQTKWVVFGIVVALGGFAAFITAGNLILPPQALQSNVIAVLVAQTGFALFLLLIPISIAIAILRSRLYDIDVIINRTLVYGSLTAILALIYVGGVIGAQAIINAFAQRPNEATSPILIVVTTLLIAALFQPLRRGIQRTIDRRFYRRKYNVEQTLSSFSATLRQEVNLGELNDHLLTVVQQTMEPTNLSLWLRASGDHP